MYVSLKAAAFFAAATSLFGAVKAGQEVSSTLEDCNVDFADHNTVGKSTGYRWCASQIQKNRFVSGIKTWSDFDTRNFQPIINGMQILFDNGDWTTIGKLNGEYKELLWDPAKTSLKEVEMCGDNAGSRKGLLSIIRVSLTDGQKLYSGCRIEQGCKEDKAPWDECKTAARGTPVAVEGMAGDYGIEQLTWHTVNSEVKQSKITDVKFKPTMEELNARRSNEERGLLNQTIVGGYLYNDGREGDPEVTYHFKEVFKYTRSRSWTTSTSNTWHLGFGAEIEFEANLIVVDDKAKASLEFFWEHKKEKGTIDGVTSEHSIELWVDVTLKPGQAARVQGYAVNGIWDVTWTGKQSITFKNDKTFVFDVEGTIKDNTYSDGWLHTSFIHNDELLKAAKAGEEIKIISEKGTFLQKSDVDNILKKIKEGSLEKKQTRRWSA